MIFRLAAILALAGGAVIAEPCRETTFEGTRYTVCEVAAGADLRLFLRDAAGATLGSFARIDGLLAAEGARLAFAMNAGMYHRDRSPVGLHVEQGQRLSEPVTAAGPGNFGMLPNGVFCVLPDRFAVIETRAFVRRDPGCIHATQSGPLLVIDGALHPRFIPGSPSRFVRNGVGISADGRRAAFAISGGRVSFHDFARFFRDHLGLRDALYLDGNISRLHAPGLGRSDIGFPMGPVVGLVVPR
ncbi:MAG: phosphodiester glycosidase family protein [Gemmobacter sp.]